MRRIPKYPNYMITEDGRVWSVKRRKFLKPIINGVGYSIVNLYEMKKRKTEYIHHLVARCYLPKPKRKDVRFVIHHIDGDKTNNHYMNLEYSTHSNNTKQMWNKKNEN